MTELHLRRVRMIADAPGPRGLVPGRTLGDLWHLVGGVWQRRCRTLEDPVRAAKVAGVTAIPAGRYRVSVTWSPAFQRPLPILHDVPEYEGIRMHRGRTPAHTRGCILVGLRHDDRGDLIDVYGTALAGLLTLLTAAPGWITISDDWRAAA
jgi:hypothetical protein